MQKLDKHVYSIDEIVIGGDLSSLLYAFYTDRKIVFVNPQKPFLFDEIRSDAFPGLQPSHTGKIPSVQAWEYLVFILGLNGQIIGSDLNRSIRIQEDVLKISTEFSRLTRIKFKKLFIFDPEQVNGLPSPISAVRKKHDVYDWFNVKHGSVHVNSFISTSDDHINKIWFYKSDRLPRYDYKDCVVLSKLTDEQINEFDYSETVTRIKMENIYKELGIHIKPELDHAGREIKENIKYTFDTHEQFEFFDLTPEELIDKIKLTRESKYVKLFPHGRYYSYSIEADRL